MLELTTMEDLTLRTLRCACRPLIIRMCFGVAVALVVYWIMQRIMGWDGVPTTQPTLYDPRKLHETLTFFAATPHRDQSRSQKDKHQTEHLCRQVLEAMIGLKLPKVRPKWLVNPTTKRCLELDMYNEEHKLAFEYDGSQHDVYTPHYHTNEHHFQYRKLLDKLKNELCREAGVSLIRIPWMQVSCRDEVRTARFLEQLLYTHGIPHRSVLKAAE